MPGGSRAVVTVALISIPLVGGTAWLLGRRAADGAEAEAATLRARVRFLEQETSALKESAAAIARKQGPSVLDLSGPTPTAPASPGAAAPAAGAGDAAPDAAPRAAALRVEVERAVGAADGEAALAALRGLLELLPEGREAAIPLVLRVQRSRGALGIREMRWAAFVSTSRLPELMAWSLENPAPAEFREFAAWSLPWRDAPEATLRRYEAAFPKEESLDVAKALAEQAAALGTPASRAVLAKSVSDTALDPILRAVAATALVATGHEDALRLLREIAAHEGDPGVREAARIALVAANPPADGYLVTMIAPDDSWYTAGLRAGDIVTAFDGKPVGGPEPADFLWKGVNAAQEAKRTPRAEVFRDGRTIPLDLTAEFPVIVGLPVKRGE